MVNVYQSKFVSLPDYDPHYSNPQFNHPQTIFLAEGYKISQSSYGGDIVTGVVYSYSDRLIQWNYNKAQEAWELAKTNVYPNRSAGMVELYLRNYFDNPRLELVHILAGVNLSNGYSYRVFGYFEKLED